MPATVDYSALFQPISGAELERFRSDSRARRDPWAPSGFAASAAARAVVGVILTVGVLWVMVTMVTAGVSSFENVVPFLVMCVVIALVFFVKPDSRLAQLFGRRAHWEQHYRRYRFAEQNGLIYVGGAGPRSLPGAIFGIGSSRSTTELFRSARGPEFEFGNHRFETGSKQNGRERRSHEWGYIALRMPRRLPHMLLDARSNNGLFGANSLPISVSRDQRLSLEGDFDRHFTLYCPEQYERDALYIFTPDLMALLIDESSAFDVEIVDDWMLVYSTAPFQTTDAATMQRILTIVDRVGAKASKQAGNYADERIGDRGVDLVTPRGQRLRGGLQFTTAGLGAIAAAIAFVAFMAHRLMS